MLSMETKDIMFSLLTSSLKYCQKITAKRKYLQVTWREVLKIILEGRPFFEDLRLSLKQFETRKTNGTQQNDFRRGAGVPRSRNQIKRFETQEFPDTNLQLHGKWYRKGRLP